jgi:hypothetical protein
MMNMCFSVTSQRKMRISMTTTTECLSSTQHLHHPDQLVLLEVSMIY